MTQFFLSHNSCQELQFSMMLRVTTDKETKEYPLKKLYELSLKSIGEIPQLDEPTYEQKKWVIHKIKAPEQAWRSFR